MTHVVLIPTTTSKPIEVRDIPDLDDLRELLFADAGVPMSSVTLTPMSFYADGFQILLDDIGTWRTPLLGLNERAMILAARAGYNGGVEYPLLGPVAVIGVDARRGTWLDVPEDVVVKTALIAALPAFSARS